MAYDLKPMKAPRTAGRLLKLAAAAAEHPATHAIVTDKLLRDVGVMALRARSCDEGLPSEHPLFARPARIEGGDAAAIDPAAIAATKLPARSDAEGFAFETAGDFAAAYREGRTTPEDIAWRSIEALRATETASPRMALFIAQDADDVISQARASTERYRRGAPIGPLDGVPVAVKDEVDQTPYPTTVGTRFLGREPARADAEVVARLRAAGAVLVGKANMHEIGLGVTGLNPHHGAARNPYDPARATGGSSSGSAASVAAGICPIAVGADGGGSIRIPASLCGVVGLKATFGRISEHGAAPLCWSVAHVGPIGATARDVALGYAIMAGPDSKDANTQRQPPPRMDRLGEPSIKGVRIGIYRPWFEDAEPEVVRACRNVLDGLRAAGATIVDIEVPELPLVRTVHLITIIAEMAASHSVYYARHRTDYGLDVRLSLAVARRLGAFDYINAQRHRARLCANFDRILETVDVIATPATARTAPLLPADALETGESNVEVTDQIMRYATPGNLTGLPAISWLAGYDSNGLPIGFQAMGRAWEEHLLLQLAMVGEPLVRRRKPRVHHRLLPAI